MSALTGEDRLVSSLCVVATAMQVRCTVQKIRGRIQIMTLIAKKYYLKKMRPVAPLSYRKRSGCTLFLSTTC